MSLLTDRQREILQCAFDYDGNFDKVAEIKHLSTGTVKQHFYSKIFSALMVNNLCGAFRVAQALGIISLEKSLQENKPDLMKQP